MPSRRIILFILFFFLIIGLIVCFVSYQVASWLLAPRGGGGGNPNDQTVIVRSINAAENTITLQDNLRNLTRINYTDNISIQRQNGGAASENDIYQCSTLSVAGSINGVNINANRITILSVNQLTEGQQLVNITDPNAELRGIPDPRVQVLSFLPQGTRVSLRGHCSTWLAIIAPDGRRGWIQAEDTDITTDRLNALPSIPLIPGQLN